MKRKTLPLIVAGLLAGATLLGGCSAYNKVDAPEKGVTLVTRDVVPLGVEAGIYSYGAYLGVAFENDQGQPQLGYVRNCDFRSRVVEASALIQGEMNDVDKFGQKDPITLTGILNSDGLQIKEIYVHGHTIKF